MNTYYNIYQLAINGTKQSYHVTISNLSPSHILERKNDFIQDLKNKGVIKESDQTSFIYKYTYS